MFDVVQQAGIEVLAKGLRKRICTTRLLLSHVQGYEYVVLTPNGDVQVEQFDPSTATYVERNPADRSIPLTMGRLNEDFDPMPSQEDFEQLVARAETQADELLASREAAPPPMTDQPVSSQPRMSAGPTKSVVSFTNVSASSKVPVRSSAPSPHAPSQKLVDPPPSLGPKEGIALSGGLGALSVP